MLGSFQVLVWCTITEGALYRTVAIGGAGGIGFDDLSALGNVSNFRPRQLGLWQRCANISFCSSPPGGIVGLQTFYSVCQNGNCTLLDRKLVVKQFWNLPAKTTIVLEHGDFIEKMYGYMTIFPYRIIILNGAGFVINRRGDKDEIFVGKKANTGMYIEVLGPLVAFWGGVGSAFDMLGAYIDPSVWPERPSRIVAREMYGRHYGVDSDTYFSSIKSGTEYYAIRLLNFTIFSTHTSIVGIAATFQNDIQEIVTWNVGTGNPYTHQSNTAVFDGSVSISAIRIPIEAGEYVHGQCGMKVI